MAVEEAQQLSSLVQQLHAEKAAMQAAMQKLQRESQYLTDENALLRNQLTMAMNGGWVGGRAQGPGVSACCRYGVQF